MNSRVSQERGFTILELVAVVAVSSVLALMGLPLVKDYQQSYSTAGVSQRLAETLASARERAVSMGESVYICGSRDGAHCSEDAWTQGWLVYQSAQRKLPGDEVPTEEIIEHFNHTTDDYRLTVMDESFDSVSDIRFDARGFNGAQQRVVAVMCGANTNVELDAVMVERTGRVRVGKNQFDQSAVNSAKQDIEKHFDCNQA
jgi:prepilin-type N-terminal cleavage/methylation domain-containing protein